MIDVAAAHQDRRHQREHLATRQRPADPAYEPDRRVDQRLQTEAGHQRPRHDQPGIGHQRLVIKGHVEVVNRVRYSTHWKCLPAGDNDDVEHRHRPSSGRLFRG